MLDDGGEDVRSLRGRETIADRFLFIEAATAWLRQIMLKKCS